VVTQATWLATVLIDSEVPAGVTTADVPSAKLAPATVLTANTNNSCKNLAVVLVLLLVLKPVLVAATRQMPGLGREEERLEARHLGDPAVTTEMRVADPRAVPLLGPVIAIVDRTIMARAGTAEAVKRQAVLPPGSNNSPLQRTAKRMRVTEAMPDMLGMPRMATELRLAWLLRECRMVRVVSMRPLASPVLAR